MGKSLNGKDLGKGLSQRKDGFYIGRFTGSDGKRHQKCFSDLHEAQEWIMDTRYRVKYGKNVSANATTVDEWFWTWIDDIKGDSIRVGTRRAYINRYKHRIEPKIGSFILSDVRPIDCQNVLNYAQDEGDAMSSVRKCRVIMREFFEAAKDNEMIADNPIVHSVTYAKQKEKERRVLTVEEQKKLLELAEGRQAYPVFAFALQTGMRVGELMGLKWSDINMDQDYVQVQRSLDYREETSEFVENPPKSVAGNRKIPLTKEAMAVLEDVRAHEAEIPVKEGFESYIFRSRQGKPFHRGNLNRVLRKIAGDAGMESLSMHTLRHSFATRCIESGMRPKTLQKLLGHATLTLTMDLYVHVTDDSIFEEMKRFESSVRC